MHGSSLQSEVFDDMETAWRFGVWRHGDAIATERTDVAGMAKQRPIPPARKHKNFAGAQLGHPVHGGAAVRRNGEYLGAVETKTSSSVGRGRNKWVQPKAFVPWNGGQEKSSVTATSTKNEDPQE